MPYFIDQRLINDHQIQSQESHADVKHTVTWRYIEQSPLA